VWLLVDEFLRISNVHWVPLGSLGQLWWPAAALAARGQLRGDPLLLAPFLF